MNKYRNKRTIVTPDGTLFDEEEVKKYNLQIADGIRFDSKAEAEYYLQLKANRNIKDIQLQPVYVLQDKPKITYRADFLITWADDFQEVIDVKGAETTAFRMKKRMFIKHFPHLTLTLVKRIGRRFETYYTK